MKMKKPPTYFKTLCDVLKVLIRFFYGDKVQLSFCNNDIIIISNITIIMLMIMIIIIRIIEIIIILIIIIMI